MSDFFGWLRRTIFGEPGNSSGLSSSPPDGSTSATIPTLAAKDATPEADVKTQRKAASKPAAKKTSRERADKPSELKPSQRTSPSARGPYFFQIGLDFGTAYSKCIVRDVMKDSARVFVPPGAKNATLPFLFSSRLRRTGFSLDRVSAKTPHYDDETISLLKMALSHVASGRRDDPSTRSIRVALDSWSVPDVELSEWVEAIVALFLASILGEVRSDLRRRFPGLGQNPKDYVSVNLAIPVADISEKPIWAAFERVLHAAWLHSDGAVFPIDVREWIARVRPALRATLDPAVESPCSVYPEVSANVQGFVRSRASTPGVYLFCDTGAGTVDQSLFIFSKREQERLIYLGAQVLPLGSATLEHRAAAEGNGATPALIEALRKHKETGKRHPVIDRVREGMVRELSRHTLSLLATVKVKKFETGRQLNETELIFGGGGHVPNPYETGVRDSFAATIFPEGLNPRAIGLPAPVDLELPKGLDIQLALRRLSVAYGLSFPKFEIAPFVLPDAVAPPKRLWKRGREIPDAPSKDDC